MKKQTKSGTKRKAPPAPKGTRSTSKGFAVVGIGASAGGYEAFVHLLQHLPSDTGMAFILVQHLDPNHESKLSQLLAHNTPLPITEISGPTRVEPNHIYVIPPNRLLTISDGILHLQPRIKARGAQMTIDRFFQSLAQDQGNRAIGIILSGTGLDGTLGLRQIKAEGGITMAQDEKSAKYPSMPRSAISAGSVDYVLSPEAIARELNRIAKHPALVRLKTTHRAEPALAEGGSSLSKMFRLIFALTGIDFTHYKQSTLKRRMARRLVLMKMESLGQYLAYLQQHPRDVDNLLQDLLISVTSFFRDPSAFLCIKRRVLPRILKRLRPGDSIRVWVPGCSTGEEAYSLAICLHEALSETKQNFSMQIFATDVSEHAIATARSGIYSDAIIPHVSPERLRRYFVRTDNGFQIAKFIRDACVFARQNVIADPPFSKLDLISCRNLLIYLGPILQKKVLPLFHYALQPGGFLMLGTSETTGQFSDLFTLVDNKSKIYSKVGVPSRHQFAFAPVSIEELPEPAKAARKHAENDLLNLEKRVNQILLSKYMPNGVVVNAAMEVLHFCGQTGPYLEHASGEASLSLLKMVREPLVVDLRTTAAKAVKLNEPVRKEGIRIKVSGHYKEIAIEVAPFRLPDSQERFYLVLFHDLGIVEPQGKAARSRLKIDAGRTREIARLRQEIDATKESLQSIIEEQEATNEELKSANEEIQSSNEELQSTNEELETAKEELQSTNEELTTLNQELQNRNSELSQVNNDLSNLLSSVNLPILMLGNDLTIRRFTPLAEKFFNLIPSDVGRRISDINPKIQFKDLAKSVTEVIDSLNTREHEVQDEDGRWFSLRIRPYRTADHKIDGAVIVIVDIHETRRALEEIASIFDRPLLLLREDFRVLGVNEAFCRFSGIPKEKVDGMPFFELGHGEWNIAQLRNRLEAILNDGQTLEDFSIERALPGGGRDTLLITARPLNRQNKLPGLLIVTIREAPGQK